MSQLVADHEHAREYVASRWHELEGQALPCLRASAVGYLGPKSTYSKSMHFVLQRPDVDDLVERGLPVYTTGCTVRLVTPLSFGMHGRKRRPRPSTSSSRACRLRPQSVLEETPLWHGSVEKGCSAHAMHCSCRGHVQAWVSHKYKFIYVRMLKAASSTILLTLFEHICSKPGEVGIARCEPDELVEFRSGKLEDSEAAEVDRWWKEYFVFSFIRNPWSRLSSAYFMFTSRDLMHRCAIAPLRAGSMCWRRIRRARAGAMWLTLVCRTGHGCACTKHA